ncbi:cytochrome P450 [Hortaea werneckii]|uniref:Cytochrome P450 n=1 Tax=Hortaea werneckii TaxID=91943 RepID=A0A3M7AZ96_HORWE|nr:cytochrome P450 [Hortaea werneckii]KAI7720225.1 cytochrome P450 [Hortaea werneckii]RMY32855.1 hypothetical protein D0865_14621 [Hortaea werneckii]
MLSYITLTAFGLAIAYVLHTYRCYQVNLAAAKQSGIPFFSTPIYTFNRAWLITHRLWLPFLKALPESVTKPWLDYMVPEFVWTKLHDTFKTLESDVFLIVAPGANTLYVADAEAVSQITTRRNDFPKPTWIYASVDIFGKNVVSTEGQVWRHHRKITSPPFTEKNNHLVWTESLHQAQSMLAGWIGGDGKGSGAVWDVASQAMRLSLHVISRAGFGVRLQWPHEETQTQIPEGHTLSYKDALSTLLENIIVVMLTPRWILAHSPLKIHKDANEAYVEWGKYMREMYRDKRTEVKQGESREGMDLMGALVKGAGITTEALNDPSADPEKAGASPTNKQLLTDDEILGNAFVFILAGHETAANTIHFSLLFLALHPSSQRRLQKDLDQILGDKPISEWDYEEDVPKLFGSMCGAVMNEELRLIPPVVGIPKSTPGGKPQGMTLGGKPVTVPGGCNITLNTAALHRNPRYWPHSSEEDLLDFRPERWVVEEEKGGEEKKEEQQAYATEEGLDFDGPDKRADTSASLFRPAKGAYIPFSDGYRSCLGRRFAQVEILAVLAVIFKNWSVELDVGEYLSDQGLATASDEAKREAWGKAKSRSEDLLRNGMMTIITIQMRSGKVPMRFVRRGEEKFNYV